MASQSLASLVVDLKLETAGIRKDVDQVKKSLGGLGGAFDKIGAQVTAIGDSLAVAFAVKAVRALAEFALHGAEAADKMGKLAAAAQLPIDTFARLSYAARLSDLSAEDMGASFNKLNKALGEAAGGSRAQIALFQGLGVSIKDSSGQARDSGDVFKDVAAKLSEMAPGYAKATLEQELFGKSGTQLDLMLKDVASGMADVGGETDGYAAAVAAAAGPATEFNDNVERMKIAVEAVAIQVAANLAPAMADLTKQLLESKDAATGFNDAAETISTALRAIATVAVIAVSKLREMAAGLAGLASIGADLLSGNLAGAIESSKAYQDQIVKVEKETAAQIEAIWKKAEKVRMLPEMDFTKSSVDPTKVLKKIKDIEEAQKHADENRRRAEAEEKRAIEELIQTYGELQKALRDVDVEKGRLDFGVLRSSKQQERDTSKASFDFANIGASPEQALARLVEGFGHFDDAMKRSSEETKKAANYETEAALLFKEAAITGSQATIEAAEEALLLADEHKDLAKEALGAAEALKKVKDAEEEKKKGGVEKAARETARRVDEALAAVNSIVSGLASKMGEFGSLVQTAMQGFQAGGIWGAIIAVIIEMLSKFERFKEIVDQGNAIVADLLTALGPMLGVLVDGLHSFLGGINSLLQALAPLFAGPMRATAVLLDNIGGLLTEVFDALGPAMDAIGGIIDAIMAVVQVLDPMKPIIKILGAVFKLVGIGLLELNRGLMMFLGWVFDGIRNLMGLFNQTGALDSMMLEMSKLAILMNEKADAAHQKALGMWDSLGHTFDDPYGTKKKTPIAGGLNDIPSAAIGAANSLQKLGDTADSVSEQLTNVPTGYKVATARFLATFADLSTATIQDLVRAVNAFQERKSFALSGTSYAGGGAYAAGGRGRGG